MPFSELSLRHASCRTAEFIWKETSEILASPHPNQKIKWILIGGVGILFYLCNGIW
jgi:lipid-A-disaccharide synthase-like uncharacterized protein